MKIIMVKFDETVNITPFPKGKPVTLTHDTTAIQGIVMATCDIEDPPPIEGIFHLKEVES